MQKNTVFNCLHILYNLCILCHLCFLSIVKLCHCIICPWYLFAYKEKRFLPSVPIEKKNFILPFNFVQHCNIFQYSKTCIHTYESNTRVYIPVLPEQIGQKSIFLITPQYFSCLRAWVRHYTRQSCYCFTTKDENRNVNMAL